MTGMAVAVCMALAALGAVGALAQADPPANPFAGSWSGTWSDIELPFSGTFDWTISHAGRITGRVYITGADSGTMVGHVRADGKLGFVGFVPNDDPATGWNGVPWAGTAVIDSDGKLVVSVTRTDGTVSLVATLERN